MLREGQIYLPTVEFQVTVQNNVALDKKDKILDIIIVPNKHYLEITKACINKEERLCEVIIGNVRNILGENVSCPEQGRFTTPIDMITNNFQLDVALTMQNMVWLKKQKKRKSK